MMWGLAIKSELGDTWHMVRPTERGGIVAWCNYHIRLDDNYALVHEDQLGKPATPEYICKRCKQHSGRIEHLDATR